MKRWILLLLALGMGVGALPESSGRTQESFGPSGARVEDPGSTSPAFGPNYGVPGAGASPPDNAQDPREEGLLEPSRKTFQPAPQPRPENRSERSRRSRSRGPAAAEREILDRQSVLQRFAEYRGPRTVSKMGRLFEQPTAPRVVQRPPIALADGNTPFLVEISGLQERDPDIALSGAHLDSMDFPARGPAVLTIVPEKNTVTAAVFILINDHFQKIPLTVVPPLPKTAIGAEDLSSAKVPRQDFNADGEVNYVDDYIYVGNFLAGSSL